MPNTAAQPSSAMAARIAVSAPAAAVRASSDDQTAHRTAGLSQLAHGPMIRNGQLDPGYSETPQIPEPPRTAVTAQLQAAEAMRRSQQAQIDAQQQEMKRRQVMAHNAGMAHNVSHANEKGSR